MFPKIQTSLTSQYLLELGILSASFNNSLRKETRCREQIDFLILGLLGTMATSLDFRGTAIASALIATTPLFLSLRLLATTQ